MPLIRVSDEVYQHFKNNSRDGESIDATIRRITKLSTVNAYRKYADREKLIPLEAYRWMILSAYMGSELNAPLKRAYLQTHVENLLDEHNLAEVYPADFSLTPSKNSPRTRWKARIANIVGRLEESKVLNPVINDDGGFSKGLEIDPNIHKEFMLVGLHIDRKQGKCHLTQMPKLVTSYNWNVLQPLTVDEEVHPPLYKAEDGEERLKRVSFLYNQRDLKGVMRAFETALLGGSVWVTYDKGKEIGKDYLPMPKSKA